MAKTLIELIERVRRKADQENSSFVTNDEIRDDLNWSLGELYDLVLVSYNAEYFVDGYSFSTVANQTDYALPTDFYKLAGVDVIKSGQSYSVDKYNFDERNMQKNSIASGIYRSGMKYRLYNSNLRFLPAPTSVESIELHYIPQLDELVLDTDTININLVESWVEYAIIDVAIKIGIKEETDVQALMAQKGQIAGRISAMKENRDFANAETIKDVYAEDAMYYYGIR